MNRRDFLKNTVGLLALVSFPLKVKNEVEIGVDPAAKNGDYTGMLVFSNVVEEEFESAKENYLKHIAQQNHCICGFDVKWIKFDETI